MAGRARSDPSAHSLTRGYRAKCVTPAAPSQGSSAHGAAAADRSPGNRVRRGGAAGTRRRPPATYSGCGHDQRRRMPGRRPRVAPFLMPEMPVKLTAEDLVDLPEDDGEGCGCDFGLDGPHPWPVLSGGMWRPWGARSLGEGSAPQ
jgi:hypothetical protein